MSCSYKNVVVVVKNRKVLFIFLKTKFRAQLKSSYKLDKRLDTNGKD